MESRVQVAGRLDTPAYEWPLRAGIAMAVLAPVSYGLRSVRWRGRGRLRAIVRLLRWIGPARFVVGSLVALGFALAVRQARRVRRRDLEILPDGFALLDRRGRRAFEDDEVVALGFRARSAPAGMVAVQRGRATLWVDGREGLDRLELDWEYPDAAADPLAGFLGRLADRVHARAVRTIDSGSVVEGDGWELSRSGLQVGHSFEILPFASIAQAEYHDGRLMVWRSGEVEPAVRVAEGSKNDAILHAILIERMAGKASPEPDFGADDPGLGRLLFERRPSRSERAAGWIGAGLLAGMTVVLAAVVTRLGTPPAVGVAAAAVGLLAFVPALIRQRRAFRFHERGVRRESLAGDRELRFEDLAGIGFQAVSPGPRSLKVVFEPDPGRGLRRIVLFLEPADEAIETIRSHAPGGQVAG